MLAKRGGAVLSRRSILKTAAPRSADVEVNALRVPGIADIRSVSQWHSFTSCHVKCHGRFILILGSPGRVQPNCDMLLCSRRSTQYVNAIAGWRQLQGQLGGRQMAYVHVQRWRTTLHVHRKGREVYTLGEATVAGWRQLLGRPGRVHAL